MIKTISIGDIHGKTIWKTVNPDEFDKIIFLGDYVDDWPPKMDKEILDNLLDIISFKEAYPEKVILLWGNHELNYTISPGYCSGFRSTMLPALSKTFKQYGNLFQLAYQIDTKDYHYLWTHAGVHRTWFKERWLPSISGINELDELNLAEQLNHQLIADNPSLFDIGHIRGGYYKVGGPFWVDKSLFQNDPIKGYFQIVGHSKVNDIEIVDFDKSTNISFIDCQEKNPGAFYYLNIYDEE